MSQEDMKARIVADGKTQTLAWNDTCECIIHMYPSCDYNVNCSVKRSFYGGNCACQAYHLWALYG